MDLPFSAYGYRLREALRSDRPYLLECMRSSILGSVSGEEREMSGLWMDSTLGIVNSYMDSAVSRNAAFILEREDGRKAGMIWMEVSRDQFTCDDTGYLLGIYVEEEFRGQGLGRALMGSAERWCSERGLLSLTLNVGSHNLCARSMYERMGFGVRSTVMRKDLRR